MQGFAKPLLSFMQNLNTSFVIPVYQRNYDWSKNNCEQLFNDLQNVLNTDRNTHFFGSTVSMGSYNAMGTQLSIIDGQQRLTTVTLIFMALQNLIKENAIKYTNNTLLTLIEQYIYTNPLIDKKNTKLKPVKNDRLALEALLKNPEEYILNSNITENYKYFYNRILASGISADELYKALAALVIIDISLDQEDDAQLIFESLNSTGLELSEGDKIRNFILMGLDSGLQEKYYEEYWNPIEKCTNYNVSGFIRHYLTIKLVKTPNLNTVYTTFKSYAKSNKFDDKTNIEILLIDLLKYAKYYNSLLNSITNSTEVNNLLKRFNILDMTVCYPYMLSIFEYWNNENIADKVVVEIISIIESYVFRRTICDVPTNALNKIFCTLHKDCLSLMNNDSDYVEVLKYILINKSASGRLPKDNEFLNDFKVKDVYHMQSKNKSYLFDKLENQDSRETSNVIENIASGVYSIEHIMPQTLSATWKDNLGTGHKEIHETWLHRIANLTLTGYNSSYSNKTFEEKLNADKGFKDSNLRLNKYVGKCEKWTEFELEARNQLLMDLAVKLWPYPQTVFKPIVGLADTHTLSDDSDFYTGRKIANVIMLDTHYKVKSWKDMYIQVVKVLYELNSANVYMIVNDKDDWRFASFDGDGYSEIAKEVFLYTSIDNKSKIIQLQKLFNLYNLSYDELIFELIPEADTEYC